MFLCILRALTRTQNTQKHVLQLGVACGDQPVQGIYYWFRTLKAQGSRNQRAVIEDLSFNNLRHDFAYRVRAARWLPEEVAYYLGQVIQQGMTALQAIIPSTPVSREQVKQKINDIKG